MNIKDKHSEDKKVSLVPLFKGSEGSVSSMHLVKDGELPPHITKVPALLTCVLGKVVYLTASIKETLNPGDYVEIEPMVEHWINGLEDSHLLLIK